VLSVVAGCAARPTRGVEVRHATEDKRPASPTNVTAEEVHAPDDDGPMPAGLCGFEPYLSSACGDAYSEPPRVALVLRAPPAKQASLAPTEKMFFADMPAPRPSPPVVSADEIARARNLLAHGKTLGFAAGYPFAIDWHELPSADRSRRGIAIVGGLFKERELAKRWLARRPAIASAVDVVDLGDASEYERRQNPTDGDYTRFLATRRVVVEVIEEARAFDDATVERFFERADHNRDRLVAALAKTEPKCTVPAGSLFVSSREELYRMNRELAPVMCGRTRAWIAWTATRLEAVVTRSKKGPPLIHQVVEVSCDSPSIATRPFGSPAKVVLAFGTCRG
jgi:hypothetical protein